ncbi:DUF3265 domain-containing protein [Vibrio navarrensis]|nr:DUF3265 domain-containing protein [Vibrio navarrensis]EJL6568435.1 DUF3265 domain-containing protein [Vibrio navarrensis]
MTKRLRGIRAAWHFWYAVVFGGESSLRKAGLGGTHPLTRRYAALDSKETRCLNKKCLIDWLKMLSTF